MDGTTPEVKHVLFYVGLRPGRLMLVETMDGRYCILRDESPMPQECWDSDQLAAAIARYQAMKAELGPG